MHKLHVHVNMQADTHVHNHTYVLTHLPSGSPSALQAPGSAEQTGSRGPAVKSEDCFPICRALYLLQKIVTWTRFPGRRQEAGNTHRSKKTSEQSPRWKKTQDAHSTWGVKTDTDGTAFLGPQKTRQSFPLWRTSPNTTSQAPALLLTRESPRTSVSPWRCMKLK